MAAARIGLIGFGEVGYIFSQTLTRAGAEVMVYDVLLDEPGKADDIKKHIIFHCFGLFNDVIIYSMNWV